MLGLKNDLGGILNPFFSIPPLSKPHPGRKIPETTPSQILPGLGGAPQSHVCDSRISEGLGAVVAPFSNHIKRQTAATSCRAHFLILYQTQCSSGDREGTPDSWATPCTGMCVGGDSLSLSNLTGIGPRWPCGVGAPSAKGGRCLSGPCCLKCDQQH